MQIQDNYTRFHSAGRKIDIFYVQKRVDISMVVICYASDMIEYDRRTSELSNAPLRMKKDTTSIEK